MDRAYAAVLDTVAENCVTVGYYDTAVAAGVAAVVASFNRDDDNEIVIVGVNDLV